eukprot:6174589-Amphidinium_carterae.1
MAKGRRVVKSKVMTCARSLASPLRSLATFGRQRCRLAFARTLKVFVVAIFVSFQCLVNGADSGTLRSVHERRILSRGSIAMGKDSM